MCTLTLIPQKEGYLLTMNRDERRTRHEAGLFDAGDICYPVDGEAKGTWVGVNQQGVAMGLLNRYQEPSRDGAVSRGHIIPEALQEGAYEHVVAFMKQLQADKHNPFDAVVVSDQGIHHFSWSGREFSFTEYEGVCPFMLSSSSVNLEDTLKYRQESFAQWTEHMGAESPIESFHLLQIKGMESASVMMSRELTHTKSLTQIEVSSANCALAYYDESAISPNTILTALTPTAEWDATEGMLEQYTAPAAMAKMA